MLIGPLRAGIVGIMSPISAMIRSKYNYGRPRTAVVACMNNKGWGNLYGQATGAGPVPNE
jgi:hypothetical protein